MHKGPRFKLRALTSRPHFKRLLHHDSRRRAVEVYVAGKRKSLTKRPTLAYIPR
jgi:hypothetical protein